MADCVELSETAMQGMAKVVAAAVVAAQPAPRTRNQWKPPEWLKYVTTLAVIAGGFVWNNMKSSVASNKTEVQAVNEKVDALELRLPIDYVPRAEHLRNAEIDKALAQERDARVSRIEVKVDQILQNQEAHR